jgi:hypothetical protein
MVITCLLRPWRRARALVRHVKAALLHLREAKKIAEAVANSLRH